MPSYVMMTNDDGWNSVGLFASWLSVKDLIPTTVIAPESHVSGVGKAITILRPLRLTTFSHSGMEGYKLDGTPADCVNVGIHRVIRRKPGFLVSGINLGPNLGLDDLTSSGTMGACLQAAMYGIPSLCISYCLQDYSRDISIEELSLSRRLVGSIVGWVFKHGMPEGFDVIITAVPEDHGKTPNIRETRLATSPLPDIYEEGPGGELSFRPRTFDFYQREGEDTDVSTVMDGDVSISALGLRRLTEKAGQLDNLVREVESKISTSP